MSFKYNGLQRAFRPVDALTDDGIPRLIAVFKNESGEFKRVNTKELMENAESVQADGSSQSRIRSFNAEGVPHEEIRSAIEATRPVIYDYFEGRPGSFYNLPLYEPSMEEDTAYLKSIGIHVPGHP